MLRIVTFIFALATLLLATAVHAQVPEICNAALSGGIRDNYYVLTEREQYELYQKRLCDAKFSSYQSFQSGASSFKLDVPLAEGLLGLGGSTENKSSRFQEAYSRYCESTYFTSQYRDRFVSYTSKVSVALTESWLECQKTHVNAWLTANQRGVFISVTPQENFADFTVSVTRKGNVDLKPIRINDITPAGVFSCVRNGQSFGAGATVTQNEFQFTCTKPQHRTVAIAIDSNDGVSNTVNVPASVSKLAELNDRLLVQTTSLKEAMQSMHERTNSRFSKIRFTKACVEVQNCGASPPACPSGFRDTGFTEVDSYPGGRCGRGNKCRVCYTVDE